MMKACFEPLRLRFAREHVCFGEHVGALLEPHRRRTRQANASERLCIE